MKGKIDVTFLFGQEARTFMFGGTLNHLERNQKRTCRFDDLTGHKFGLLTVVGFVFNSENGRHSFWECKCECGNVCVVRGSHLKSGHTSSCGCWKRELCAKLSIFYKEERRLIGAIEREQCKK